MREGTEVAVVDMGEYEDMELAKQVGEILESTYPGYLWMVSKVRGDIIIKNGQLGKFGQCGFIIDGSKLTSHYDMRYKTICAGGELLERCNLPRDGRTWNGDMPRRMDGADPARQRWYESGDVVPQ